MPLMRILRAVSMTEGVSFLVLVVVAMPLKYVWHLPLAVKYVGWAHGALFISLGALTLLAVVKAALPFRAACLLGIAALLPTGPFFADRLLRDHEQALSARRGS